VGMLMVLDGLQERAEKQLGIQERPYDRMKRIIGQSLYGVDVMPWAVHVAELRLWLQLIIETQIEWHEMKIDPLLPNLSFKVRPGDSLVQEVGGINFALHRQHLDISSELKGRLKRLKDDKLKFYSGAQDSKLREVTLKHEELSLFRDVLFAKKTNLEKEIKQLTSKIESPQDDPDFPQFKLDSVQYDFRMEEWKRQRSGLQKELIQVESAHNVLAKTKEPPFIWDLAFVEIFEGDKKGFDIVIGNPPYVRQEKIAPTGQKEDGYTTEEWREIKKRYKEKLQHSVIGAYPEFHQIDNKSDLYVYFYLHGLSLLNPKGSFCFITSNSWLDVGYGRDLQEFLLNNCQVKMIIDNQAKRSFAQADVNTIIALFSAPDNKAKNLDNITRFVMFKVPYEDILSPIIFWDVEDAKGIYNMTEGRIYPISQKDLLVAGMEIPDDETESVLKIQKCKYVGDKWGGKYLRAPDIFFKILEKGKGKLVRLGDIADVRRGVTTGANEFFYLDQGKIDEFGIEEEFLKPVIKSPRECKSILIDPKDLKYKILMCHEDKSELRGTNVLEYIKWGEKQGFHRRPSCSGRARWWDLGEKPEPHLVFNYLINTTAKTLYSPNGCYASDNFQEINFTGDNNALAISLNSAIFQLFVNMAGRSNFGGGLLKIQTYEIGKLPCIHPEIITYPTKPENIFDDEYWDILQRSDARCILDNIVFNTIELTGSERDEIYEAIHKLVKNRLEKARSV